MPFECVDIAVIAGVGLKCSLFVHTQHHTIGIVLVRLFDVETIFAEIDSMMPLLTAGLSRHADPGMRPILLVAMHGIESDLQCAQCTSTTNQSLDSVNKIHKSAYLQTLKQTVACDQMPNNILNRVTTCGYDHSHYALLFMQLVPVGLCCVGVMGVKQGG